MTDLGELDTIELTPADMEDLLVWRNNNVGIVMNFQEVIKDGIIDIPGFSTLHFKFGKNSTTEYELYCQGVYCAAIKTKRMGDYFKVLDCAISEDYIDATSHQNLAMDAQSLVKDVCTIVTSCMAYMGQYKDDVDTRLEYVRNFSTNQIELPSHNKRKVVKLVKQVHRLRNIKKHN